MPDMEKEFEALHKAVGTKTPKLDETVILNAIAGAPSRSRKRGWTLAVGGFAVAATAAVALTFSMAKTTPLFALGAQQEVANSYALGATSTDQKYGSMMPAINYNYVPGPELSWMGGSQKVYELRPKGNPIELIKELGEKFGLSGEITADPYQQNDENHYFLGDSERYDLGGVDIYWSGTASWSVFMPDQRGNRTGVLSDEQYKELAQKLFSATGLNVPLEELALYKANGRSVVGTLKVNGQATPIQWSMNWDEYGNFVYANGHALEVVDRGFASTISEREAVSRIGDWRYSGFACGFANYGGLMVEDMSVKLSAAQTKDVIASEAEAALVQVWDKNHGVWLLPGYVYQLKDEYWKPTVFSLVDGLIELPDHDQMGPY